MSDANRRIDRDDRPRAGPEASGVAVSGEVLAALSPDAIVAIDASSTIIFANPAAERLFGYPRNALLGRDLTVLVPPRLRARYRARFRSFRQREQPNAARAWSPFRGIHRTGQELPLEISLARWAEAARQGVICFVRDVGARQRAEQLATERVALLGQIADGVVIADPSGRVTFVNEAARRLLGVTSSFRTVERFASVIRFLTPAGQPYPVDDLPLLQTVRTGTTVVDVELGVRRPDGTQIIVQSSSTPIVAADGTRLGSVATFRDVTTQRELELRKSEFLGAVSHELRTPLTVIQGQAQLLARRMATAEPRPSPEVLRRLAKIDETAKLMTGLVNRLIEITRCQLGPAIPVTPRSSAETAAPAPEVAAIGEVAQALVQEMALERVASIIVDHGLQLFNAAAAAVWLFDPQHTELRPLAMRSVAAPSPATLAQLQILPLDPTTLAGAAARLKQPVELPDIRAASPELTRARDIFARESFRSGYAQPLLARGRLVGVLSILYAAPHAFIASERALIQALGDFGAVAIDHAQVYRKLEEAVDRREESLALLDRLVETAPIGFAFLDRELRFVRINQALAKLDGLPIEQYRGRTIREVLPWLANAIEPILRRVLTTGAAALEVEVSRGQGRDSPPERSWLASIYPVCLTDDQVRGVGVVMVEITERKRSGEERERLLKQEQAARQQAERLAAERAAIVQHIADGVILADARGIITYVNEAARRLVRAPEVGISLTDYAKEIHLFRPDGQPYAPTDLLLYRAVFCGETNVGVEQRVRQPGHPEVIIESSAAPIVAEDGTPLGAVLTLRDVTAQRELEHQRDAFYSAATHDLKNPLTVILASAERLEWQVRRSGQPELLPIVPTLEKISMTAKKMVSLIDELMDVTRLRLGRPLELNRRPTDLVSLLRQVVAEYQASTDRLHLRVVARARRLVGCWDAARLERLFGNLLSNAIKYSPAGGDVVVEVSAAGRAPDRWAVVQVRDQGMGIPAADLPYIFDHFRRATNVATRIVGSGIGLASARYLAQQHGGTITVESKVGVGSTFTVRLPVNRAESHAAA